MLILIGILAAAVLFLVVAYNSLIGKKNQVEKAFGSVDVMLKKRYDLIPNLIESVKAYMTHEKDLLTKVTEARTKALSGNVSSDEKVEINNAITQGVRGIMVAVENYPDLKASANFIQVQKAMNEVEEQISAARRSFNAAVTDYNNAVEMFPTSILAGMMSYQRKPVFEIPAEERQNVNAGKLFGNKA